MRALAAGAHLGKETSLAKISEEIADSGLLDARGNSGSILVETFYGLADGFAGHERVSTAQFARAATIAAQRAASAVDQPREGTILTVLRVWAAELERLAGSENDFARLLVGSLATARQAVHATTEQLAVLGESGVVDAGAQGFVYFLEGVVDLVERGVADEELPLENLTTELGDHGPMAEATSLHRYCTECLITGSNLDKTAIRKAADAMGDSVVVAGSSRQIRVHLHTDQPGVLFERLASMGDLQKQKVDDMARQQEASRRCGEQAVAIITDAGCDLPPALMDELNIHLVPHRIVFGKRDYMAKVTMDSDDFYSVLERSKEHPKTSQPTPSDYIRTYEYISAHFRRAISIMMSGKLSGTYQSAKQFAARVSDRIEVVDTRTCSVGQGIVVLEAARDAQAGLPITEIMKGIERRVRNVKSLLCVETLKYLIRGGRLGRLKGLVGQLLGMKPIFQFDAEGGLQLAGRSMRGWSVHDALTEKVIELGSGMKRPRVAIAHGAALKHAEKCANEFAKRLNPSEILITTLSPVMGVHGGGNTLGIAILDEAAP
jgi:DegV family protein with EDD domain